MYKKNHAKQSRELEETGEDHDAGIVSLQTKEFEHSSNAIHSLSRICGRVLWQCNLVC